MKEVFIEFRPDDKEKNYHAFLAHPGSLPIDSIVEKTYQFLIEKEYYTLFEDDSQQSKREKFLNTKIKYKNYLETSRIFISDDHEIDGFRRLIFLGSSISIRKDNNKTYMKEIQFIGVRLNGQVISGYIIPDNDDQDRLDNIDDILDVFLKKDKNWHIKNTNYPKLMIGLQENFIDRNRSMIESVFNYPPLHHYLNYAMEELKDIDHQKKNQIKTILHQSLDQEILDMMKYSALSDLNYAKWLTGGDGACDDIIKIRRQAASAYPIFGSDMYFDKPLYDVIENSEPLVPALASLYKKEKKHVKRLNGLKFNKMSSPYRSSEIIDFLPEIPEKIFPISQENFDNIELVIDYANIINASSVGEAIEFMNVFFNDKNPWKNIKRMDKIRSCDVRDSLCFLQNKLFIPAILNRIKIHAQTYGSIWDREKSIGPYKYSSLFELFKHLSMKKTLDLSERYHRNIIRYDDILNDNIYSKNLQWSPLIGDIDLENGYIARELHSASMLKKQGRDQNHCVGGYARSILEDLELNSKGGRALLIFSLEKNKEIHNTVLIECQNSSDGLESLNCRILEERSYQNHAPSQEAQNISKILLKRCEQHCVKLFNEYLHSLHICKEKHMRNKSLDELFLRCGFNPFDETFLSLVWDELKPILPHRLSHLGLDGFIDMMPLTGQIFRSPRDAHDINIWEKSDIIGHQPLANAA